MPDPTASTKFLGFDTAGLPPSDCYKLLAGSVVPRPIAWVSTVDADGIRNLAPFSFFTVVSADPPVLCFCPSIRGDAGLRPTKDTLENVRATGEFVVNLVSEETAEAMNATAAQLAPEADEFLHAGLFPVPCEHVRVPRVGEAKVALECRLREVITISSNLMGGSMVLGDVLRIHVREDVLEPGFRVDPDQLRAIGRLSGSDYIRTGDRFSMKRPK